jgi:hypothetical protein
LPPDDQSATIRSAAIGSAITRDGAELVLAQYTAEVNRLTAQLADADESLTLLRAEPDAWTVVAELSVTAKVLGEFPDGEVHRSDFPLVN